MKKEYRHINLSQRYEIKKMLDDKCSIKDISKKIGVSDSAIYRELARGSLNGNYEPEYSERRYQENLASKGTDSIISTNLELANYISSLILENNMYPEQIIEQLKTMDKYKNLIKSRNTIYKAIDEGLIPNVTRNSLISKRTIVFGDGNVHIAKWIRKELNISIGDELKIEIVDGVLILSK